MPFVAGNSYPRAVAWSNRSVLDWLRDRLRESGQDPSVVADEPFRLIRLPEVRDRTGLGLSTIYRKMSEGSFPRPVRIDGPRNRAA